MAADAHADAGIALRWDDAAGLTLQCDGGEDWQRVAIRRCFPMEEPRRYFSLAAAEGDASGKELALIEDPAALDESSREALARALAEASFLLRITKVRSVEKAFELWNWEVETEQGPRTFQAKLGSWPRHLTKTEVLIEDICGDLYHIPDTKALDAASQKALWSFVD